MKRDEITSVIQCYKLGLNSHETRVETGACTVRRLVAKFKTNDELGLTSGRQSPNMMPVKLYRFPIAVLVSMATWIQR
ncbi:hypothetical protein E2C01_041398 [Portunus trituberculatus]|uniref:Uncharacterized protein n=1 Tax=Portunus trituberculatus TaxID=210409 RepID=A0A5B7FQB6_PORTR|nr:hypothetical protein [Portunus trituberculatus]